MRHSRLRVCVALAGLLVGWPVAAQDLAPDPLAPNEAIVVVPGEPASFAAPAQALVGPTAPRVLHQDRLFFHNLNPLAQGAALKPDWMAAHFIDVGQGAAVLLEFSCGVALIDVGGEADEYVDGNARFMAYLKAFFDRRPDLNRTLDVVFLTHAHGDHTSGAALPRKANPKTPQTPGLIPPTGAPPYKIRNVVTNAEDHGSGIGAQTALIAYAKRENIPNLKVLNADITRSDGLTNPIISPIACPTISPKLSVLWGSERGGHGWESDGNNHSLVIRVDFGESSFLFIGDLEQEAQPELISSYARYPAVLDVDVYLAGHHGSQNGTTRQLAAAMSPEVAVIASGDPSKMETGLTAHDFGHPNLKILQILEDPVIGVSKTRPTQTVAVGIKGRNTRTGAPAQFDFHTVERAIYATGWDGDIVITASAAGEKKVHTK